MMGKGIGFLGLLTIAFIVLKLTETIAWSWVWIVSPIWLPIALVINIGGIVWGLYIFFNKRKEKRIRKAYLKMKTEREAR
jgi:hypothetical protein